MGGQRRSAGRPGVRRQPRRQARPTRRPDHDLGLLRRGPQVRRGDRGPSVRRFRPGDRRARPGSLTIPRPPSRSGAPARLDRGTCPGSPRRARRQARFGRTSSSRPGTWDRRAPAQRACVDRVQSAGMPWPRDRPSRSWPAFRGVDTPPTSVALGGALGRGRGIERQFPVGAAAPRDELKWVEAIWAGGDGRIVTAISLGDGPQIYASDDDGLTWRVVRGWRSFVSGNVTLGYRVELLGDRLGARRGGRFWSWSTVDGGGSWRRTTGASRVLLDEVSVASPDHAWAVHRCDRLQALMGPDPYCGDVGVKSVLLATSDGGRTWEPLGRLTGGEVCAGTRPRRLARRTLSLVPVH